MRSDPEARAQRGLAGYIKQLVQFGIAGAAGFAADAGVLYALLALGLNPYAARLISFLFAVFVTWRINRRYTFSAYQKESAWREWLHYLLAMSAGGICNYGIYAWLIWLLPPHHFTPMIALGAGSVGGMIINFCSAKFWVFR